MIDFIIPCHPKDFPSLRFSISGLKNISRVNRIFVISQKNPNIEGVVHVPEEMYDKYITRDKLEKIWSERNPFLTYRAKWLYQQFLKLLSVRIITDLTESFVIVDADTIFLRDVSFDTDKFYYCKAEEYHTPYLKPIRALFGFDNTIGFSCICHHMIFKKNKLTDMLTTIENKFGKDFVSAILSVIDFNEASCFSEWDTYANYMLLNYPELCQQRQLKWHDISFIPEQQQLENFKSDYDFVSCHAYRRGIE
jgi:hypothetical protein